MGLFAQPPDRRQRLSFGLELTQQQGQLGVPYLKHAATV
jgi:hypothetical protein